MSRRPHRPALLSRQTTRPHEEIVTTALTFIEEEGLEAFSTRKLGARLGLQAMSLYHYFPSREALFMSS